MNKWVWSISGMILMGKLAYLETNLSQCHFVSHKSYMDWPGIEPRALHWEAVWIPTSAVVWLPDQTVLLQHRRLQSCFCTEHSKVDKIRLVVQGWDMGPHFSARLFLDMALQISESSCHYTVMCVPSWTSSSFSHQLPITEIACIVQDGGGL
jgi:hypothetical protein